MCAYQKVDWETLRANGCEYMFVCVWAVCIPCAKHGASRPRTTYTHWYKYSRALTHSHFHSHTYSLTRSHSLSYDKRFILLGKIGDVYCAICHAHATHTATTSISPIDQHTLLSVHTLVNCCLWIVRIDVCLCRFYVLVFSSYLFVAWRL